MLPATERRRNALAFDLSLFCLRYRNITAQHTHKADRRYCRQNSMFCCQDVTNYRNCSRQLRSETIRLCLQSKDSSASHIIPSIARKRKKKNNRAHMQKPHTYCIWSCESLLMQYMFSLAMQSTWTLHEKTHHRRALLNQRFPPSFKLSCHTLVFRSPRNKSSLAALLPLPFSL